MIDPSFISDRFGTSAYGRRSHECNRMKKDLQKKYGPVGEKDMWGEERWWLSMTFRMVGRGVSVIMWAFRRLGATQFSVDWIVPRPDALVRDSGDNLK